MTPQILRRKDVEATVGLSRSTIYHLISQGLFPAPIKLGKRAVGWHNVLAGCAETKGIIKNTSLATTGYFWEYLVP